MLLPTPPQTPRLPLLGVVKQEGWGWRWGRGVDGGREGVRGALLVALTVLLEKTTGLENLAEFECEEYRVCH